METTVVGVRFQEAGKIYYFEPGGYDEIDVGSHVVVETSRGVELGRVVIAPQQVLVAELTEPLKPIIRPATFDDVERATDLKEQAREVTALARERARALNLPMKVSSAQFTLDGQRVTVFFTSEDRVDFRDLIRDLGHQIHAQVQLRQVGPRDQAKLIGGYGRCGRRLCCTSWLTAFPSISIRMAKEQSLPLNPAKISGQCGRLLCCLSYENDIYKQLRQELPKPDSWLSTPTGEARVISVNAIKQVITLQMQDFKVLEFTISQLGIEIGVTRPLPNGPSVPPQPLEVHNILPAVESTGAEPYPGAGVHPPHPHQPGAQRGAGPLAPRPVDRPAANTGPHMQQPRPAQSPQQRPPGEPGQGRRRNRGLGRPGGESGPSPAQAQTPSAEPATTPPPSGDAATADGAGASRRRRRRRHGKKSE